MRGEQWLRGAVWAVFCGAIVTFAAAVTSATPEPSLWVRDGNITKTVLEDPAIDVPPDRDSDCVKKTIDVLDRINIVNSKPQPVYYQVTNDCWHVDRGGTSSANGMGYLQSNGMGSMLSLADATAAYRFVGDKVIRWGGGPMRYFSTTTIIGDPIGAAILPKSFNTRLTLGFDENHPATWTIYDPGTVPGTMSSSPTPINSYVATMNGTWMVAASAWGYLRINLDTAEILPFEAITLPTGYEKPYYGMAISENGRYVFLNRYPRMYIYDLSTCNNRGVSGRQLATGCGKRDITEDVRLSNGSLSMNGMRFNSLGDTLTYYAYVNNSWKRYGITAPGQAEHGIDYLALGDSYTSGEGDGDGKTYYLPGTDGDGARVPLFVTGIDNYPYDKEKCHLSSRSYPFLLAGYANLHADGFRSVACSGADANDVGNDLVATADNKLTRLNGHFNQLQNIDSALQITNIKTKAVNNFIPGRAAQIEFVAKYKPKVLTIGLSGNDIDFGGKLTECLINLEETCRYATTDTVETIRDLKDKVYTRFSELLKKIKTASPTTRIYAVGYPQLIGLGACNSNVQLDAREQAYVRATLTYLNDTIEAAAALAGVNYLDIEHSLDGANLCSDQRYPAINGLTHGDDILGVLGSESYHPNEQGHASIAAAIRDTLHGASIDEYNPCGNLTILHCNTASSTFPNPPAFFMSSSTGESSVKTIRQVLITDQEVSDIVTTASGVKVAFQDPGTLLNPNSDVYAILKSTPVNLSPTQQLKTDDKGWVNANLQIPVSTKPGVHTLHLIGTMRSGESIDYYQPILVVDTMNDYDGDGIANADDTCQFVTPSGVDNDDDGIDDACEGDLRPHTKPIVITPPVVPAPVETTPSETAPPSSSVLGTSTGSSGALTPYQGPSVLTQNISNSTTSHSADDNDAKTKPATSATANSQSSLPGQESIPAVSQKRSAKDTAYIWYVAGGTLALILSASTVYRLRR